MTMRHKGYIYLVIGMLMLVALSCKKYGYDVEHGYDKGGDADQITTDTSGFEVDKSMFDKARIFPGLVDSTERRIQDTTVIFNLNYDYQPASRLGFRGVPQPIFSSGLYAGPGELVEITVPAGLYGLTVQVGFHSDNLTGMSPLRREPLIFTVKALFPGKNQIRNPFGGYIWIKAEVPTSASAGIKFKGATKAPDFILGVTTDVAAWQKAVLASKVPWLEIRGKSQIFSVSRNMVEKAINQGMLNDIDKTMTEWDFILTKDFYEFNGLSPNSSDLTLRSPQLPERRVQDIQLLGGVYAHATGQPMYVLNDTYWFNEWMDPTILRQGKSVGTFNQISTNYQPSNSPWWAASSTSSFSAVAANFSLYKEAARNGFIPVISTDNPVSDAFLKALLYAKADTGKLIDRDPEVQVVTIKLLPFVQIFSKLGNPITGTDGYGFHPFLIAKAKKSIQFANDAARRNFVYTSLCEYTRKDCASFFDAWGIPLSDYHRDLMYKTYPPLDKAIWEYNPLTGQGGDRTFIDPRVYHVRTDWEISANTSETVKEVAPPTNMIDGDVGTIWHSCYGCTPNSKLPFVIEVDMQKLQDVDGFYISSGGNKQKVKRFMVSVSNDYVTWSNNIATFTVKSLYNRQLFDLPAKRNFRYFRLSLPDPSYANEDPLKPLAAIGEIGTYFKR